MPAYKVTGPDGASYRVNAPEGASEADAIAWAQKNLAGGGASDRDKFIHQEREQAAGPSDRDKFIHQERADAAAPAAPAAPAPPPTAKSSLPPTFATAARIAEAGAKTLQNNLSGLAQTGFDVAEAVTPAGLGWDKHIRSARAPLDAEVAANEVRDRDLFNSTEGTIGKVGGNVAMAMVPYAGWAKGAQAASKLMPFVPKALIPYFAGAGALGTMGAAQTKEGPGGSLAPITEGVAEGVAGAGIGAGLGRAAAPFHGVKDGALDPKRLAREADVETLKQGGLLPRPMAQNYIPDLAEITSQASKTPGYRGALREADEANRGALTQWMTSHAGGPQAGMTSAKASKQALDDALKAEGNMFRAVPGDVPVTRLSKHLKDEYNDIEQLAQGTTQKPWAAKTKNAAEEVAPIDVTVPGTPAGKILGPNGQPLTPGTPGGTASIGQTRTIDELMTRRAVASRRQGQEMESLVPDNNRINNYRTIKEHYDTEIKAALKKHGGQPMVDQYEEWLKNYGQKLEFDRAATASKQKQVGKAHQTDTLDPIATAKEVVGDIVTPGTAKEKMLQLLADTAPGFGSQGAGVASEAGRAMRAAGVGTPGSLSSALFTNPLGLLGRGAALGGGSALTMGQSSKLLSTQGGADYLRGKSLENVAKSLGMTLPEALEFLRKAGVGGAAGFQSATETSNK